jgi:hypothetical protein
MSASLPSLSYDKYKENKNDYNCLQRSLNEISQCNPNITTDFSVSHDPKNLNIVTLTINQPDNKYKIVLDKIRDISGKSGDKAYIVADITSDKNHKSLQYVLKIFTKGNKDKQKKDNNEIQSQLNFCSLFENYKPCPQIYYQGHLSQIPFQKPIVSSEVSKTFPYRYMLMELYDGITLDAYIANLCTKKQTPEKPGYVNINMYDIILQLFYLICMMQVKKTLIHCDLHGKNIFIIKTDKSVEYDFNIIGIQDAYKTTGFIVKLLDFGESSTNNTGSEEENSLIRCAKRRLSTKSLLDLKATCKSNAKDKVVGLLSLAEGEIIGQKGNVDINFLANIIGIIQLTIKDNKLIQAIDTDNILEQSSTSDYNTNFKEYLKNIYAILCSPYETIKMEVKNIDDQIKSKESDLIPKQNDYAKLQKDINILIQEIEKLTKEKTNIQAQEKFAPS